MADVTGTGSADQISGSPLGAGSVFGLEGDDTISAYGAFGNSVADVIGTDTAFGGAGDDLFRFYIPFNDDGNYYSLQEHNGANFDAYQRALIAIGGDGIDTVEITGVFVNSDVYQYRTLDGSFGYFHGFPTEGFSTSEGYGNLGGPPLFQSSGEIDDAEWYSYYMPGQDVTAYNLETRKSLGEDVENYSLKWASVYGSDGAENITSFRSVVYANGGDDTVEATASSLIHGGDGNDYLLGSNDLPNPGHGNEDHIDGGAGNDTIFGNDGGDTVRGGDGDDFVVGHPGADYVMGNDGDDTLWGSEGSDFIQGGNGDDLIHGHANKFTPAYSPFGWFDGPEDVEHIHGNDGNDTIVGGIGQDNILGGAGADLFHVGDEQGYIEALFDFSQAEGDRIQIPAFSGLHDWITVRSPEEAVANQVHPTANESWVFIGTDSYGIDNWVAVIGTSAFTTADFVFV